MWKDGIWRKGNKKLTGRWIYNWAGDHFWVHIDGKDPETGLERRVFKVYDDHPEFGEWKLERK